MPKGVSIRPSDAVTSSLADLCFEDAIEAGKRNNEGLKPHEFHETSIRFSVDGLHKWLTSYTVEYYGGSIYSLVQNSCWHWASFCEANDTLNSVRKSYFSLLKNIAEKTDYTDLADDMDRGPRVKSFGYRGRPTTILLPTEVSGSVQKYGTAMGLPFSLFFQVGLGWSLSCSRKADYSSWVSGVFQPLFDEVMSVAKRRASRFREIQNTIVFRDAEKAELNINRNEGRA